MRWYKLHYINIPLSASTGIAAGGVAEHVFIVTNSMTSQCLSLRRVISKQSKAILNQIENLRQVILGGTKMFCLFGTVRDIGLGLEKFIGLRTRIPRFLQI